MTPESKSAAYAESKIPNANSVDAPFCTTGDRWEEIKEAFFDGYTADRWIPVSQPPEESGRYWCYVSDVNDLGVSHYQWNCAYTKHNNSWTIDRLEQYGGTVTHWHPLPSPPTK